MGPFVIRAWCRVIAKPMAVVDRDPHLRRIAIVQAVGAAVVLVPPEVLWVIDVRIVVESLPILSAIGASPSPAIGLLSSGLVGR